jgi:hypothetical protein
MNDDAIIVKCNVVKNRVPFKIHQFPNIKLFPVNSISSPMEYFDTLDSLDGYIRFLREEGTIDWFSKGQAATQ